MHALETMLVDRSTFLGFIFARLVEEHREILAILDGALEDGQPASFRRLARILRVHARAEELIVFPALDGSHELGHHVHEDVQVHRDIDQQLRALEQSADRGPAWRARAMTLREILVTHFGDEELRLFPGAQCVISDQHSQDLLNEYERECAYLATQRP